MYRPLRDKADLGGLDRLSEQGPDTRSNNIGEQLVVTVDQGNGKMVQRKSRCSRRFQTLNVCFSE